MEKNKKNNSINLGANESSNNNLSIYKSILISIKAGINGALILFTLLESAKFLSYFSISNKGFYISANDLIISFWGFTIVSFIVLAGLFKDSD